MIDKFLYRIIQLIVPIAAWFIRDPKPMKHDCHNCANFLPLRLTADAMNDHCSACNTTLDNARQSQMESMCGPERKYWKASNEKGQR